MNKKYLVIFLILLALVLILLGCKNIQQKNCDPIDRVNNSLPSYLLYTNENENMPKEFLVFGPMLSPDTFEDNIIYKTDGWNFYCKYNSQPAEKIEYFYHSKPCLEGAWHYRYAYICGDKYYIFDARNAGGVRLYGPFDVASQ